MAHRALAVAHLSRVPARNPFPPLREKEVKAYSREKKLALIDKGMV